MTTTVARVFETLEWGPAPESSGPAQAWLEARGRAFGHFVGGRSVPPADGETIEVINPATTEPLAPTGIFSLLISIARVEDIRKMYTMYLGKTVYHPQRSGM